MIEDVYELGDAVYVETIEDGSHNMYELNITDGGRLELTEDVPPVARDVLNESGWNFEPNYR